MERRSQERDIGLPNSMAYTPPQIIQESPVKLPLAPILSTPSDRRGNAMVSTRRGSSIFSPTQTLDQQYNPSQHHHHQQLSPPPPPPPQEPLVQKDPTTDPDPPPITATPAGGGTSNSKNPPPPQPPPQASVKYRECLKNHAASMGGHVLDGCGEFMPSGEEGTLEALRCAACDCHRNFHRREVDGQPPQQSQYYAYNPSSGNNNIHRSNPLLHGQTPSSVMPPHQQQHPHKHSHSYSKGFPAPPTIVNFGGNGGGAAAESSSEDLNMFQSSGGGGGHAVVQPSSSGSKKRFRTKFSQDQKDRMHEFASKIGWRIQKQDEEEVQQFCSNVGVQRQVFKVWMHNNKQAMKKRQN